MNLKWMVSVSVESFNMQHVDFIFQFHTENIFQTSVYVVFKPDAVFKTRN